MLKSWHLSVGPSRLNYTSAYTWPLSVIFSDVWEVNYFLMLGVYFLLGHVLLLYDFKINSCSNGFGRNLLITYPSPPPMSPDLNQVERLFTEDRNEGRTTQKRAGALSGAVKVVLLKGMFICVIILVCCIIYNLEKGCVWKFLQFTICQFPWIKAERLYI